MFIRRTDTRDEEFVHKIIWQSLLAVIICKFTPAQYTQNNIMRNECSNRNAAGISALEPLSWFIVSIIAANYIQ